jgi:hypothetical protein
MLPKPKSYKFGHLPLLRCLAPSLHKLHESELLNNIKQVDLGDFYNS